MTFPVNPCEYGSLLIDVAELSALERCLSRRDLFRYGIANSVVDECERRTAELSGSSDAVVLCNGTAAIRAMLAAAGVIRNDRVVVSAFTFHATASAVFALGAEPYAIDFDSSTNIDLAQLESALKCKPAAVVAVHLPGRCFDLSEVARRCDSAGVPLLEDAAQAFACAPPGGLVAPQGLAVAVSFQQGKLVTCGEGGAVVSSDADFIARVRAYSDHGVSRANDGSPLPAAIPIPGDNLRLAGPCAAVLSVQLSRYAALIELLALQRKNVYRDLDAMSPGPWAPTGAGDIGQNVLLRFASAELALEAEHELESCGVLLRPIWRRPFPDMFTESPLGFPCPNARALGDLVRLVPLPPVLGDTDRSAVTAAIRSLQDVLT